MIDLDRSLLLTRDGVAAGVLVPVRQSGSDRAGAVDLEIVAHPDHAALYAGLVDRAVAGLPPDARGDVWAMGPAEKEALRARGFRSTASHVRLHRDLAGDEQEPPARDAARVRLVEGEEDRRTFHATVVAVFSDGNESAVDPYDVWSARMDSSEVHDPSQWWLLAQRTAAGTWQAVGLVQGNRQDAEAGGAWIKNCCTPRSGSAWSRRPRGARSRWPRR